ncbi:MAG: DUF86 domain-containing protein [Nanoarchaeota archaeon]|nr:DUF86 domain-containing protein [Nanoarchaeota archaeon]
MEESSLKERINEKIQQIEIYLDELKAIVPKRLEVYKKDILRKAACERYFEKIIEAIEDLNFLIIDYKKFEYPDEENEIFEILRKNKIISDVLTKNLKEAKRMRNFIAHQYGKIDDERVFNAVNDELTSDSNEFIKSIKKII